MAKTIKWLERYKEHRKLEETVKLFRHNAIPSVDEFIDHVGRVYRSIMRRRKGLQGRIELEIRRLDAVYAETKVYLKRIARLPTLSEMPLFHRLLVELFVGKDYDKAIAKARKALKIISRIYSDYRLLVITSRNPKEAAKLRREACGRILSVVRRLAKNIELVRKVRMEIIKTHVVTEGLAVVVVAGPPNAGKSTLVRLLSTAKPEVASYPFTTKTIIVGKVEHQGTSFYLVDTPGILEEDPDKLSTIERKALITILALADIVLFLLDPASELLTLEEQVSRLKKLLNLVHSIDRKIDVEVALNKIDLLDDEELAKTRNFLAKVLPVDTSRLHMISAEKALGIEELVKDLTYKARMILFGG
ncbi:MAG: GTPase [Pyrodictiaceae archaeon]